MIFNWSYPLGYPGLMNVIVWQPGAGAGAGIGGQGDQRVRPGMAFELTVNSVNADVGGGGIA